MELVSSKALGEGRKRTWAGERTPVGCCEWAVFVVFVFFPASWYSEVMLKFNESPMLK